VAMTRLVLEREAELKVAPMRRPVDQRSANADHRSPRQA
jgi:hypothetical protein